MRKEQKTHIDTVSREHRHMFLIIKDIQLGHWCHTAPVSLKSCVRDSPRIFRLTWI